MARALAEAGAKVVLVSRDEEELGRVAAELTSQTHDAVARPLDISQVDAIESWVQGVWSDVGPIEIVLHSAGHQHRAPAIEVDPSDWEKILTVNLTAPFFLSRAIGRRQIEVGLGGSHIFIGSLTTRIGISNAAPYAASKAGLAGVVRTLAVEWASSGIRVNAIAPGYFRTALTEGGLRDPEVSAWVHSRIPIGRLGVPDDLGGAAVFLASPASSYMTGAVLDVDGGWLAG
jgi:gluconate 5-dehydrogenase/2-deoxy-D-gluconate 3-dehydrogenase